MPPIPRCRSIAHCLPTPHHPTPHTTHRQHAQASKQRQAGWHSVCEGGRGWQLSSEVTLEAAAANSPHPARPHPAIQTPLHLPGTSSHLSNAREVRRVRRGSDCARCALSKSDSADQVVGGSMSGNAAVLDAKKMSQQHPGCLHPSHPTRPGKPAWAAPAAAQAGRHRWPAPAPAGARERGRSIGG